MAVLGVVALLVACQVQVRLVEEPYLLSMHQFSYRSYARRSGRFLPLLGRLRHTHHSPADPAPTREALRTSPHDGHPGPPVVEQ